MLENIQSRIAFEAYKLDQIHEKLNETIDENLITKLILLNIYRNKANQGVHRRIINKAIAYMHYKRFKKMIESSTMFDESFYIDQYPDVRLSRIDPIFHYLCYGAYEGRNPSKHFNTNMYILNHPELFVSTLNPLIHYIKKQNC